MVGYITGTGTGLERSSAFVLGAKGVLGSSVTGRAGENAYVNVTTGGLVIQNQDEFLVGLGLDVSVSRTYNSLGNMTDENGDNWRQSNHKNVSGLTGTFNSAGSTITRTSWDGSSTVFTYDASRGAYVAKDGAGAYDIITGTTASWTWTDGDSRVSEIYDRTAGGRLASSADIEGNIVNYTYTGAVMTKVGVATGLQNKFSWTGVAAAGVSAGAMQAVGGNLPGIGNAPGQSTSLANYASHLGTSVAGAVANASARSLLNGSDFGDNLIAALPDVLGQTVGMMLAKGVTASGRAVASSAGSKPTDGSVQTTEDAYGDLVNFESAQRALSGGLGMSFGARTIDMGGVSSLELSLIGGGDSSILQILESIHQRVSVSMASEGAISNTAIDSPIVVTGNAGYNGGEAQGFRWFDFYMSGNRDLFPDLVRDNRMAGAAWNGLTGRQLAEYMIGQTNLFSLRLVRSEFGGFSKGDVEPAFWAEATDRLAQHFAEVNGRAAPGLQQIDILGMAAYAPLAIIAAAELGSAALAADAAGNMALGNFLWMGAGTNLATGADQASGLVTVAWGRDARVADLMFGKGASETLDLSAGLFGVGAASHSLATGVQARFVPGLAAAKGIDGPMGPHLADVWRAEPTARGNWIERFVGKNDYSDANGWYNVGREKNEFFPLVDFQKGQNLVSLKTVDTTGSTWLSRMEDHIGDLGRNGATVNGKPANMILDLRVQPGGAADASRLIQFGRANNVTVVVKEFK